MKILILEISCSTRFCMQQTLEKFGHDVFAAFDIKEAEALKWIVLKNLQQYKSLSHLMMAPLESLVYGRE